jgi:hypothetical protein
LKFFSVAEVFNFTRPINITGMMTRNLALPVETNDTYPMYTEDQGLGFHAEIALCTWKFRRFQSHVNDVYEGIRLQFHNPYEFPDDKNQQFETFVKQTLIFFITPEIMELGETLKGFGNEKFVEFLNLNFKQFISIFLGDNAL